MASAILGIISSVLPLAIKIIMAYLDKKDVESATKRKFLDFVDSLEKSMKTPSNLRSSYRKQGDALDEMMRKIDEEEAEK